VEESMNFDIDRLARLSGLDESEATILNEAGNRSQHEDPGLQKDGTYDHGQGNQLNELEYSDAISGDAGETDDLVLEVDEEDLRRELSRMRADRVNETKLRRVIRKELRDILSAVDKFQTDSSWIYGKRKPQRSKQGQISRGFFGIGFDAQ
jgi:hypothetical protein